MKDFDIKYQIFGSSDSLDIDVAFFLEKMPPTIIECQNLVKELSFHYAQMQQTKKEINGNLVVLGAETLTEVFKGTTDELNNSLYFTYHLHQQDFPNQILTTLKRDVDLKFLRCTRTILSFFTKTIHRKVVKEALKGNIYLKLEVLSSIDFFEFTELFDIDLKKRLAFQLGQTLALEAGIELYTKSDIGQKYPFLQPFLNRQKSENVEVLRSFLTEFLCKLADRISSMENSFEYKYKILQ